VASPVPFRIARPDPRLGAQVGARRALRYADAASPGHDRPAVPRAASGLAWWQGALVAVQDDAEHLLRIDRASGACTALPLPPGPGGRRDFDPTRGGKRHKRDLECCVVAPDGRLLGFGSGSKPTREQVLVVGPDGAARYVDARALYRRLRRTRAFSGARLNLEGAVSRGTELWLFNRGNEPRRAGRAPLDASCALAWGALLAWLDAPSRAPLPAPATVVQYGLGSTGGARLCFSDACAALGGDALWYAATAEASADAIADGPLRGAVLGSIDPRAVRQAPLTDAAGRALALKLEGLCPDPQDARRLFAVVDADNPTQASELLELTLAGPWS